jgi:ribosomal protein L37E
MTLICKDCGDQYGRWRPRCPACGTVNPEPEQEALEVMSRQERSKVRKFPVAPKAPKLVKKPCHVCGLGGAKNLCLVCGFVMHKSCRSIHELRCKFTVTGGHDGAAHV